ncbi:type II secretion system F family protein [Paenibacillus sp. GP183]|uniref:type II secretion system F family protein n=1 Tax=Paenibacillus sp. GP183 TaxID=1882751 RepID=UPI000896DEB9|nr:type II secretion system F family protein [Paenibacillus sp. GP183]SEB58832.1 tight adherence protein C [Paenibacillus sp. GP183]
MFSSITLSIEFVLLSAYLILGRKKYSSFMNENVFSFKLTFLHPAGLLFLDQTKLMERLPDFTLRIHHKLLLLHGRSNSINRSKLFYAEQVSAGSLCLLFFNLIAVLAGGDVVYIGLGLFCAMVTPLLMLKELDAQIRKKQQQIIMELPEVLSTIVLLVNAGETVQRAWIRCLQVKRRNEAESPLFKEMDMAVRELEMNISFPKVMEDFSKRCAMHEVSLFTSSLMLNYKRGGNDFVLALHGLSQELWQRRKTVSKTLGEEASSKLVFPMVLIFAVVMLIVAAPALLMMNQ